MTTTEDIFTEAREATTSSLGLMVREVLESNIADGSKPKKRKPRAKKIKNSDEKDETGETREQILLRRLASRAQTKKDLKQIVTKPKSGSVDANKKEEFKPLSNGIIYERLKFDALAQIVIMIRTYERFISKKDLLSMKQWLIVDLGVTPEEILDIEIVNGMAQRECAASSGGYLSVKDDICALKTASMVNGAFKKTVLVNKEMFDEEIALSKRMMNTVYKKEFVTSSGIKLIPYSRNDLEIYEIGMVIGRK